MFFVSVGFSYPEGNEMISWVQNKIKNCNFGLTTTIWIQNVIYEFVLNS